MKNLSLKRLVLLIALGAFLAGGCSSQQKIIVRLFDPNFPAGDCNYHSVTTASDGKIYFTISTHNSRVSAALFVFDPATEKIRQLGDMSAAIGEPLDKYISHGKVHTPIYEYKGKLYFATHMSYYKNGLPNPDGQGRIPFTGGRFMAFDMKTEKLTAFDGSYNKEGIITCVMDTKKGILYGLTWPGAHLVTIDVADGIFRHWGPTEGLGEWGKGEEKQKVCRSLGIDDRGIVYGTNARGRIWQFDIKKDTSVRYIEGISLAEFVPQQKRSTGIVRLNWRTADWDNENKVFRGLIWADSTFFEFDPYNQTVRKLGNVHPEVVAGSQKYGGGAQLGFVTADNKRFFYIGDGPLVKIFGRERMGDQSYLIEIDKTGKTINHGPLFTEDNRRVKTAECLEIGPDGYLYTVSAVEVPKGFRKMYKEFYRMRSKIAPDETIGIIYQEALLRIPVIPSKDKNK